MIDTLIELMAAFTKHMLATVGQIVL